MNKTAVPGTAIAAPGEPETPSDQPARTSNIDAIVAYFESGITPAGAAGELGIELEHTLVHDDMSPVPYSGPTAWNGCWASWKPSSPARRATRRATSWAWPGPARP